MINKGDSIIKIKGLSISYENKRVLTNIHMDIKAGQVIGLVGPNGAGKSTLIKSILGIIDFNSGDVKVLNQEVSEVRKKIAYVPQRDEVDWDFPATVLDVVLMGRYPHKKILQRINKKDNEIAYNAMKTLGIEDLANRQIGKLSGGQQQRVFIARALCQEAELYFLDEPFVGVDFTTEQKIIETLKSLADKGKTLIVVHHDLSTVPEYFDSVLLLNQRLIAYGPIANTFTQENISKCYAPQLSILHESGILD
jgi:ABC-type Mn2+/Zn2+ transport system ATPase subunit